MGTLDTEFKGLSIRIEYDYEAADPATRDYPGADAAIYINQIWVEIPEELSDMFTQELETLCWEQLDEKFKGQAEVLAEIYYEEREERLLDKERRGI